MPDSPIPGPTSAEVSSTTTLRISKVLEELKDQEGSYSKLERAIREAIEADIAAPCEGEVVPRFVDRRKLKGIVENDPKLVLSLGELLAIDKYLEPLGHGLAYNPLLLKPELMLRLAEWGQISFLLGSKEDTVEHFRVNISHWDFLGMSRIQEKVLNCTQKKVQIDFPEVRMRRGKTDAVRDLDDESLRRHFNKDGPSVVCLASSRSNQMTEWMLCRMAKLREFEQARPKDRAPLPFEFVWSKQKDYVLPSMFHLSPEDALREDPEFGDAVLNRGASGFRHAGGYLVDEITIEGEDEGYTYAVCAAQRREAGQIWLLVAGLTGPATFAAASWVHKMATTLHDVKPGQRSRVFWNIVRAKAVKVNESNRETYHVGDAEVVTGGVAWG